MITLKTMPKETAAELLRYISEHEDFASIERLTGSDLSVPQVRAALRELAGELAKEAAAEGRQDYSVKNCKILSKRSKTVISSLSSREERSLLTEFGLIEPTKADALAAAAMARPVPRGRRTAGPQTKFGAGKP
jgi:hypothetical protein